MTEPRKATEVLLDLEGKIDNLVLLIQAQDFNIKILSNKLNEVMEKVKTQPTPKFTAAAVHSPPIAPIPKPTLDPERYVAISAENKLPSTDAPEGFRRTSRPETFENQPIKVDMPQTTEPIRQTKYPVQLPKGMPPPGRTAGESVADVVFPQHPSNQDNALGQVPSKTSMSQNAIPVMQRIIDKNGKSVFMANVEVVNMETALPVAKTRTNGVGKWSAALAVGNYRITIKKGEGLTKTGLEAIQDVVIDGSKSPYELSQLILK